GRPELLRDGQRQVRLSALHAAHAAARGQPSPHECVGANEDELLMDRIERRRKSRGQAMVEFALLASLLFLLVMGIFDFGRAISVYINIAEAAHEGARQLVLRSNYASTPPDSVIINATLAKIGGGGMVLRQDPCLSNPPPCTSPSYSGLARNSGFIRISPNRPPGTPQVAVRWLYLRRRLMQDAVDSGALAGAQSLVGTVANPNGQPNYALYYALDDTFAVFSQNPANNDPNSSFYTAPINHTVTDTQGGYTITAVAPTGYANKQVV